MRKLSIKGAKTRAWSAVSKYIRTKYPWCVTCLVKGKSVKSTQCGHFKHNSDKPNKTLGGNALWYEERNFGGQCTYCNCYNSGQLDDFALFLVKEHGSEILQELNDLYNTPLKWTIEDLLKVEELYIQKYNDLV